MDFKCSFQFYANICSLPHIVNRKLEERAKGENVGPIQSFIK